MLGNPVPGFLFVAIGWLVFTWVPGYIHSRTFDRGNERMEEVIRLAKAKQKG